MKTYSPITKQLFVSIRFLVASCSYSVDCGGYCRIFRFVSDASQFVQKQTGMVVGQPAFDYAATSGKNWQSWDCEQGTSSPNAIAQAEHDNALM